MAGLLVVEGLRAGYGDAIVIDGVSLRVAEGEAIALLGRNGVGKSTLLVTLMGQTRVREGRMQWKDRDLVRMRASERARAAYPALATWARDSRLNPLSRLGEYSNHPTVVETRGLLKKVGAAAMENMARLVAERR